MVIWLLIFLLCWSYDHIRAFLSHEDTHVTMIKFQKLLALHSSCIPLECKFQVLLHGIFKKFLKMVVIKITRLCLWRLEGHFKCQEPLFQAQQTGSESLKASTCISIFCEFNNLCPKCNGNSVYITWQMFWILTTLKHNIHIAHYLQGTLSMTRCNTMNAQAFRINWFHVDASNNGTAFWWWIQGCLARLESPARPLSLMAA